MDNNESSAKPEVKLLLGLTGSVASTKAIEVINTIKSSVEYNFDIRVVMTVNSKRFISPESIVSECKIDAKHIYEDENEWSLWNGDDKEVLHIQLKKWAEVILIAPLDAHTLAKLANGLCDNIICCIVRAMHINETILIICPAMNTDMWNNPITKIHLDSLKKLYQCHIVEPVVKKLACGDFGIGALASPQTLLSYLIYTLKKSEHPSLSP